MTANDCAIKFNYLRHMQLDEKYMSRCIELALLGQGKVAPNPMVGAVIVHNDRIIGEGYHEKYGEAHAEVNAIANVDDQALLKDATIYVSLEPCAHTGKTPPCADLLVHHQFKRVVIGCLDSFSLVSGKGIERLKNAGIETIAGCLENECRTLNKHFFTFHEKKRPYVMLKWAQTPNGKIDQGLANGKVTWISAPETQTKVHTWRKNHQAILVGRNTVERDNPTLTVRAVKGNSPVRVILDSELQLPMTMHCFNGQAPTIILNKLKSELGGTIEYVELEAMSVQSILDALFVKNIQSVLVEGGSATLQSFIDANVWDEAKIIIGQVDFEQGTDAPVLNSSVVDEEQFFGDTIKTFYNR